MTIDDTTAPVVVVLAAHGSRNAAANQAHHQVVAQLAARLDHPVRAAFLELAEPSIPDAIDDAAGHARRVVVLPYFLHPGRHLSDDLPALVTAARRRHPEVTIDLLDSFGAQPGLVAILTDQITGAVDGPDPGTVRGS